MIRRLCAGLVLCALLPAGSLAQSAAPLATVRVGIVPVSSFAEIYFASEMGFFRRHGLDVQVQAMQNGSSIAAAVLTGSLDIGGADLVSIASAHARGLPFVYLVPTLLNSYAEPTLALMVAGNSPIHGASDLNGKTIAVNGIKNITMLPFEAWIDGNGGDSQSVKWVEVPIFSQNDAVTSGKVDAAVIGEPFVTYGIENGERAIYMEKNGLAPRFVLAGYLATKDWAAKNRDTAAKFVAAIHDAAVWANKNPPEAGPILSKYTKIPEAVVARMKRGQFAETLRASDFQPVIDAAAKYGVLSKPFPATELFYRP
jgi:NitT/TauT family transport system substrate-binding protein